MSATNRGGDRVHNDGYPTPRWCVHRFLELLKLPSGIWMDPCAGHGQIIRSVAEVRQDMLWMAYEQEASYIVGLSEIGFGGEVLRDYLTLQPSDLHVDVIITNPPYSEADRFVQLALQHADHVAMLLRLNWLASLSRSFLYTAMPDLYVLPNRPSFVGKKNAKTGSRSTTDATEYAWMYWSSKKLRRVGRVYRLQETPVKVRREHREESERLYKMYFGS